MSSYAGANLAWQLGGDARLVRELARTNDVLVLLECRTKDNEPIDVKEILGPDWWVSQDTSNGATSGTAIAIRKAGKVKVRRTAMAARGAARLVVRISTGNSRVQSRYLRSVLVKDPQGRATIFGAHIPTQSSGKQREALGVVRSAWRSTKGRKLIFMDGNGEPSTVSRTVTAPHFSGNGVMVWAWSEGWRGIKVFWRTVRGSDHRAGSLRVPA